MRNKEGKPILVGEVEKLVLIVLSKNGKLTGNGIRDIIRTKAGKDTKNNVGCFLRSLVEKELIFFKNIPVGPKPKGISGPVFEFKTREYEITDLGREYIFQSLMYITNLLDIEASVLLSKLKLNTIPKDELEDFEKIVNDIWNHVTLIKPD